jgi:type III pantothenate kinase
MFRPLAVTPGSVCLLSGGAADHFAGLLDIPVRRVENLVLEGLARIACIDTLA